MPSSARDSWPGTNIESERERFTVNVKAPRALLARLRLTGFCSKEKKSGLCFLRTESKT